MGDLRPTENALPSAPLGTTTRESSSSTPIVTVTATIPPEVREATAKVLETLRSVIGTEIPQGKRVSMHLRYVVCPEIDVSVESV